MDTADLHVYMDGSGKFYLSKAAAGKGDMHMPVCTQEMMDVLTTSPIHLDTAEIQEKVKELLSERAAVKVVTSSNETKEPQK